MAMKPYRWTMRLVFTIFCTCVMLVAAPSLSLPTDLEFCHIVLVPRAVDFALRSLPTPKPTISSTPTFYGTLISGLSTNPAFNLTNTRTEPLRIIHTVLTDAARRFFTPSGYSNSTVRQQPPTTSMLFEEELCLPYNHFYDMDLTPSSHPVEDYRLSPYYPEARYKRLVLFVVGLLLCVYGLKVYELLQLQSAWSRSAAVYNYLINEVERLASERPGLRESLDHALAAIEDLSSERRDLRSEIYQLRTRQHALERNKDAIIDALTNQLRDVKGELAQYETAHEAAMAHKDNEICSLINHVTSLGQEILKLGAHSTTTAEHVATFDDRRRYRNDARPVKDLRKQLSQAQVDNGLLQTENDRLTASYERDAKRIERYQAQIASLNKEVTACHERVQERENQLSTLRKEASEARRQIRGATSTITRMQTEITAGDNKIKEQEDAIAYGSRRIEELDAELLRSKRVVMNLGVDLGKKIQDEEEQQVRFAELQAQVTRVEDLEAELATANDQLLTARREHAAESADYALYQRAARAVVDQKNEEIAEAKAGEHAAQRLLVEAENNVVRLENRKKYYKDEALQHERELENVNARNGIDQSMQQEAVAREMQAMQQQIAVLQEENSSLMATPSMPGTSAAGASASHVERLQKNNDTLRRDLANLETAMENALTEGQRIKERYEWCYGEFQAATAEQIRLETLLQERETQMGRLLLHAEDKNNLLQEAVQAKEAAEEYRRQQFQQFGDMISAACGHPEGDGEPGARVNGDDDAFGDRNNTTMTLEELTVDRRPSPIPDFLAEHMRVINGSLGTSHSAIDAANSSIGSDDRSASPVDIFKIPVTCRPSPPLDTSIGAPPGLTRHLDGDFEEGSDSSDGFMPQVRPAVNRMTLSD